MDWITQGWKCSVDKTYRSDQGSNVQCVSHKDYTSALISAKEKNTLAYQAKAVMTALIISVQS